jgi:hypothetical protein
MVKGGVTEEEAVERGGVMGGAARWTRSAALFRRRVCDVKAILYAYANHRRRDILSFHLTSSLGGKNVLWIPT